MEADELPGKPTCCLPCPSTDWLYPDSFKTYATVAEWLNVFGLLLLLFMLISFAILPVSKTRSHYLSVCLIISVMMVCIGFIIPLGAQPEQCYNEITPNDMRTSTTCAFSGAFIVAGCLCATVWICVRALSMNMQIVWDIIPGRKFLYFSQVVGWGIPAGLFAATMGVTGVSFRFGNACHVNHQNALAVFWGPLLGTVGIAGLLQLWTFGYCIRVYLRSLWSMDGPGSSTNLSNGGLPSYNASLRAQTARAVFQRLKKVLFLQWRGLGIVTIILVDVIFCSVVFVKLDRLATDALDDYSRTKPWIYCLVANPDNKNACLDLVNSWLVNIETIEAVLLMLSLAGLQCFIMMTRPSFFIAWYDVFHRKIAARGEFLQLDTPKSGSNMMAAATRTDLSSDRAKGQSTFEMQKTERSPTPASLRSSEETDRHTLLQMDMKLPASSLISSPDEAYTSPYTKEKETFDSSRWHGRPGATPSGTMSPPTPAVTHGALGRAQSPDYFGSQQHRNTSVDRHYVPSAQSFSGVRPPSRQSSIRSGTYDGRELYTRGGSGLDSMRETAEYNEESHEPNGPIRQLPRR